MPKPRKKKDLNKLKAEDYSRLQRDYSRIEKYTENMKRIEFEDFIKGRKR